MNSGGGGGGGDMAGGESAMRLESDKAEAGRVNALRNQIKTMDREAVNINETFRAELHAQTQAINVFGGEKLRLKQTYDNTLTLIEMENKQTEKLETLSKDYLEKTRDVEELKAKNRDLEAEIREVQDAISDEVHAQTALMGKLSDKSASLKQRKMRAMDKLKLATEEFDRQSYKNMVRRENLRILQKDQHDFVGLYSKLNDEIRKAKKRINLLLEKCNHYFDMCNSNYQRKESQKTDTEKARIECMTEAHDLQRHLDHDKKIREFIHKKNKPMIKDNNGGKSAGYYDPSVNLDDVKETLKRMLRSKEDNMTTYDYFQLKQELFNMIMASGYATKGRHGKLRLDDVKDAYLNLQEDTDNKLREVNNMQDQIQHVRDEIAATQEQTRECHERRKLACDTLRNELNQAKSKLNDVEKRRQFCEDKRDSKTDELKTICEYIHDFTKSIGRCTYEEVDELNVMTVMACLQNFAEKLYVCYNVCYGL